MLSKVTLANTDMSVSTLCYGTNMLGWNIDQERSNAILDTFAGLGGNFIDTARSYGDWMPDAPKGASERAIGAWLKGKAREDFVIATKGGHFDMRAGDYRNRVNPKDVESDLNESLDHLGVDTIDLYWLHMDNPETPVAELIDFLNAAKDSGKIRWFGASNWTDTRVLEANAYAQANDKTGFVAIEPFWGLGKPNEANAGQQGYQLYFEDHGSALKDAGLAVIPYCSQSRGYFGMLEKGEDAVSDALKSFYDNPANKSRFEAAKTVAARHGVSVSEVALAYLVNQPGQVIPIFGASSPARIEESVKAASLKLSADELAELQVG
ncbi:aryl-alcohol dehydrogenase-like predicted oxidoreductase [Sphingobium sp. OAS761]|uniref:aldo/keto reductase n=1 Tax=Sphingobium sp. OAS761 TaxID=2817901 RepID=UPI00209FEDFB|nr:aldo/keto reductase [Sphingobium sp. OAS761]MCP1471746.1 aryl-alcohol dehydrogenase-like predicted oxidoreductase [Sphingobium sp. OAS761]